MSIKIKKAAILLFTLIFTISLVSCKKEENGDPLLNFSKEELADAINDLKAQLSTALATNEELQAALDKRGDVDVSGGIVEVEDGSKRKTFTTVDSILTLPVNFEYPGTEMTSNTSSLNVNEYVKVSPGPTWTAILDGTTLKLQNIEGIYGNITVGQLNNEGQSFRVADLQQYLKEVVLAEFPYESGVWTNLFLSERQRGVDVTLKTLIDSESAIVRCGTLGLSDLSVQYMFVYKGEESSTKNEIVRLLLSSMSIRNSQLMITTSQS